LLHFREKIFLVVLEEEDEQVTKKKDERENNKHYPDLVVLSSFVAWKTSHKSGRGSWVGFGEIKSFGGNDDIFRRTTYHDKKLKSAIAKRNLLHSPLTHMHIMYMHVQLTLIDWRERTLHKFS
jgi:hypothetical protein